MNNSQADISLGAKMDTSLLENIAEDLISHKLQQNQILVAKPKFDYLGTDLLAFAEMKDGIKFCRVQCKGRSLISSGVSNIKIPLDYVTPGFVLVLYLEYSDIDSELYIFFITDIEQWHKNSDNEYVLNISKTKSKQRLSQYKFNNKKSAMIKKIIASAESSGEFRRVIFGEFSATTADATSDICGTVAE